LTGKKLKWIRNALASDQMRALVKKYIQREDIVESDDGNIIVLRKWREQDN